MYFAKVKVTKLQNTVIKKAKNATYDEDITREEIIILAEFEITSPTLEKLQEKVDAHTKLVEE